MLNVRVLFWTLAKCVQGDPMLQRDMIQYQVSALGE